METVIDANLSHRQYDIQPTPTGVDVEPLPTLPDALPPLSTGFFSLPPLDTSQAPKSCFSDPSLAPAWSCDMPFRFYAMDIDRVANATNTSNYKLALTALNGSDSKYIWGTQPPDIPDPQPLTLVEDPFEMGRGPAWWLRIFYDKTVIVSEESFRPILSTRGLNDSDEPLFEIDTDKFKKKSVGAQDGDKPWICTWPDTVLEIFVYPSQNVTLPKPTNSTGATQTASVDYASPTATAGVVVPVSSYPKVVKFLERRWGDDSISPPTCHQIQIINGGLATKDVLDKNGHPVEVTIAENVKFLDELLNVRGRSRHNREKRWRPGSLVSRENRELTECGCLWWST